MNPGPAKPKLLYVTKQLPFGLTEAFILPEIASHLRAGWDVWLAPLQGGDLQHVQARPLLDRTLAAGLASPKVLANLLWTLLFRPRWVWRSVTVALQSRSWMLRLKNLAVAPKALWLARRLEREGFDHVHVHWLAVPATYGGLAADLALKPWSVTAHRYDIAQSNLVPWKLRKAKFVRAIDRKGAAEIEALSDGGPAPIVLHMGVELGASLAPVAQGVLEPFRVVMAARFVEKKGHRDLIEAISLAKAAGQRVECDLFGEGPLENGLRLLAEETGVADQIRFRGPSSHDELMAALVGGLYHAAVLPSVTARDGDKEGIPVFLMEAMAAGLPAVTTPNGGIVELAGDGAACLVPEKSPAALSAALLSLARDQKERKRLAVAGREQVVREFEIERCMTRLRQLISATG